MNFTLIIWLSSFAFGLQTIIGKLTSKYSLSNPWLLNFFWTLFNLILTATIAYFFGIKVPISFFPYIVAGFFLAIGNILLTYSIFKLDVTVISPLFALRTAFTAIIGVIFLKESFNTFQYIMILIIFVSGLLIRVDENFSVKKSMHDLWIGITCMFFLSVSSATIKIASVNGSYWNNVFWINFFTSIFLLLTIPKFIKDIKSTPIHKYIGALGYSLAGGIGRLLMFFGLASNVTVTTAVTSLPISMLMTIPLAYTFPQLLEKHTTKIYIIRLILAAIMIGCSIKLSLR